MDILISVVFGLPLALVAFGSSLFGLIRKRYWFLVAGAVLILPSTYYLSGGPGNYKLFLLLPVFLLGSAYAVYKKKMTPAWLLFIPPLLAVLYFIFIFIYAFAMTA